MFDRAGSWLSWILLWLATQMEAARPRARRVPVILQFTAVECGAACLAMILNYYGRKTSLAECREHCDAGRDGLTAEIIARAARHFGLRVKAYSLELAEFRFVQLPAIVHWEFNHFVVVERWSPATIDIVDPAIGGRRLTAAEFDAGFTGVVLTLEPGIQFERVGAKPRPSWRHYLGQILTIRGVRGILAQILAASLVLQVLGLAVPILTKVLVDDVLPFRVAGAMAILGIGVIILVLAQMVTSYLRVALLIYLQARLDSHLMLGFLEHVLTLPLRFFQQRSSGDLLMRLGSNAVIRETLATQTTSAVIDGTFVVAYLAILLFMDPFFGSLALGLGVIEVTLVLATTRLVYHLSQRELYAEAESDSYLVEALTGIATLKASGIEHRALDYWSNLFFRHLNISLRRDQVSATIETATATLHTLSPLLLLWVGALRVLDGTMSLGTMLALNALAAGFLMPLSSLVLNGQRLQLVRAHLDRLVDVLEAQPEQDIGSVQSAPRLTGRIELRNVSFKYATDGAWVLRDISIGIEPGQKVALVGPTGSGKSTLAMLLLGLYAPTEGEILYDGIPLESLNYGTLRSQFGVVLQDLTVFSGSIRKNIDFHAPGLPLERVEKAAGLAALHNEIENMPMGYETLVAEGGTGLSGGQIQRLCIARALAPGPATLLLDEATSHLDVATESQIDRNLSQLACTRIVIAHRLSTVRNANQILVLDGGAIVERGTHDELVAKGSRYATMVSSQLRAAPLTETSSEVRASALSISSTSRRCPSFGVASSA